MTSLPELAQIEDALVAAAARLGLTPPTRASRRRPTIVAALVVVLASGAVAVAVAGATGNGPLARRLQGIFSSGAPPAARAELPKDDGEIQRALSVTDSQASGAALPADATRHLYLRAYAKHGAVCLVVSGRGSIGHCVDRLGEAGGRLSVNLGVVDGHPFVYGLAANDVTRIVVSVAGQDSAATLANNAYYAALSDQGMASQPITVTAHLVDGTTRTQGVPGLPRPAGHVRPG